MSGAALSIKLRCASWQQLATIYKRDLSRGSMFLKSSSQPPLGTKVRIDLELPSSSVIELHGTIVKYSTDPQRGAGVDLQLDPLPTKSVWMIESALAAENKVRAQTGSEVTAPAQAATLSDGQEVSAAELELIKALEAEAESLKKLNPFLVLGVGYETTDADVRHAFGELTKRYHPDRFARYQSQQLRQIAAEIFILIRDAYRRLADEKGRQQAVSLLGPRVPPRNAVTPVRGSGIPPRPPIPPPPAAAPPSRVAVPAKTPPIGVPNIPPIIPNQHDAPTNPSVKSAQLAHTELARSDLAIPAEKVPPRPATPPLPTPTVRMPTPPQGVPPLARTSQEIKRPTLAPVAEGVDTSALDELLEAGKLDEALAGFRIQLKKTPQDRVVRAGIELCEGMKALAVRDRLEAAQRFEAALELDPGNERAARELAEMRRQATNERKGLLSRLMGKKETP